jgi:thiamine-phosphate pyrophosphorylase
VLGDARLYLVAGAQIEAGSLAELVGDLAGAGVDLIQLREKEMEAGDILRVGAPIAEACRAAGVGFMVNDRPDLALALGSGVHVGQNDVPVDVAREIVPDRMVGLSTHSEEQVDGALALGDRIDYFAAGPVFETPTKPGRPQVGLGLIRYAAARANMPWFAIGGITESNIAEVMEAGARRVVVVRAITEARDPVAAAARLKDMLGAAPLG